MANLDTATIARRSVQGVLALASRSLFMQAINTVSLLVLAAFLDSSAFGVFYIVSAVISFLVYFSDIGLAAALIQKKEDITEDDLKTTFTIQQALVLIVVIIAIFSSRFVSKFYHLDSPGTWLFQALIVSFFLSSLKTIPSVLLERRLDFNRLVIPQIAETIIYNAVVIIFALKGAGVTSFTLAILARGIVGLIVIYIVQPWKPSIGISKKSAKKLLAFGFPFQTNSILALLKDDFLTIVLGKLLTRGEMGFIGISQKLAYTPLRFVMDNVVRITFPSFSRLQDDQYVLRRALEKSLFIILIVVSPLLFGLVVLFPYIVHVFPKYTRWEPAFLSLAFFAGNALLSAISTPLTNFLNAIGKIKTTLKLMFFWLVATWLTTILAIKLFSFNGVSIAAFVVSTSVIIVVVIVRRYIAFDIIKAISAPLISGLSMGILLFFIAPYLVRDFPSLIAAVIIGGLLYLTILYILARKELKTDFILIKRILRNE